MKYRFELTLESGEIIKGQAQSMLEIVKKHDLASFSMRNAKLKVFEN